MKKFGLVLLIFCISIFHSSYATDGLEAILSKGLNITAKDSSFGLKLGLIILPRLTFLGDFPECETCGKKDYAELETRRLRLRFEGFVGHPSITYFLQLGFSNRDLESIKGPNDELTGNIYDAYIDWKFIKKTKLRFGQAKLPSSLSRLMSFSGLNFLERSYAESRFNTYRDLGLQILDETHLFSDFTIREMLAVSNGEGVNIRSKNNGGLAYSGRLEIYPFGLFEKAGETYEMDKQFEKSPKLLIGGAYFLDVGAIRERATTGKALHQNKDIEQFFADFLFKWQGFSLMGEYYKRNCDEPITKKEGLKDVYVYSGNGFAGQIAYMLTKNQALALRFSNVQPNEKIVEMTGERTDYSIGYTYFLFGTKVKLQCDATYYEQNIFEKDPAKAYEIRTNLLVSF